MACGVLLALFVRHEWTYDRFREQADRGCAMAHTECAVPHSRVCLCAA